MIVNVRGTSGSGKSYLACRVASTYGTEGSEAFYVEKRKRPIANIYTSYRYIPQLYVPGHYDTPCGGCDTVKTPQGVYDLIIPQIERGLNVLYEGIMVQDDVTRAVALHNQFPGQLTVIGLTTPLEECLAGVQSRRDARGKTEPLNPKNTEDRYRRVLRSLDRLEEAGVSVLRLDREEALKVTLNIFGVEW